MKNASLAPPHRPKVVCVDDEPAVLRSLKRLLSREPYELLLTEHPVQVLEWICDRPVDLILADQRMPEMDGVDLLEIVRDYSPGTACMILSGFPDTALIVEESGLRIERLISKPWDNEELKETIRRLLESRRSLTPEGGEPQGVPGSESPKPSTPHALEKPSKVRIDCAAKSAREVIGEILPFCEQARAERKRPVVVLRNARLLADSLSRLLKGLARSVSWFHLPIDLRDESGCVSAFLEAMSDRLPVR